MFPEAMAGILTLYHGYSLDSLGAGVSEKAAGAGREAAAAGAATKQQRGRHLQACGQKGRANLMKGQPAGLTAKALLHTGSMQASL